jgi:hypothetical protein
MYPILQNLCKYYFCLLLCQTGHNSAAENSSENQITSRLYGNESLKLIDSRNVNDQTISLTCNTLSALLKFKLAVVFRSTYCLLNMSVFWLYYVRIVV